MTDIETEIKHIKGLDLQTVSEVQLICANQGGTTELQGGTTELQGYDQLGTDSSHNHAELELYLQTQAQASCQADQ